MAPSAMVANPQAQDERDVGEGLRETSSSEPDTPSSSLPSEIALSTAASPHFSFHS